MEKRKSFVILYFKFLSEEVPANAWEAIRDSIYTEENGLGITNVNLEEEKLTATLIKRIPTYILDYNQLTAQFEKKQIYIFSEVSFTIDIKYRLLIVHGANSGVPQVKAFLKSVFKSKYELRQIEFIPYNFYHALKELDVTSYFQEASIDRFNYKNGVVGKFSAKIIDQTIGDEIFTEYRSDINKVLFKLKMKNDREFLLQVCSNGSFTVVGDDTESEVYFPLIKDILNKFYA